jgi:hypothetical protein
MPKVSFDPSLDTTTPLPVSLLSTSTMYYVGGAILIAIVSFVAFYFLRTKETSQETTNSSVEQGEHTGYRCDGDKCYM